MTTQISGDTGVSQCQPNSVSQDDLQSGVVGKGPAFSAYGTALQSVGIGAFVKIAFNTEEFDTANAYDTAINRFQPSVAGYYQFNVTAQFASNVVGNGTLMVYKNGAEFKRGEANGIDDGPALNMSALVFLNGTTDYVEAFMWQNSGSTLSCGSAAPNIAFQGFLVRAA